MAAEAEAAAAKAAAEAATAKTNADAAAARLQAEVDESAAAEKQAAAVALEAAAAEELAATEAATAEAAAVEAAAAAELKAKEDADAAAKNLAAKEQRDAEEAAAAAAAAEEAAAAAATLAAAAEAEAAAAKAEEDAAIEAELAAEAEADAAADAAAEAEAEADALVPPRLARLYWLRERAPRSLRDELVEEIDERCLHVAALAARLRRRLPFVAHVPRSRHGLVDPTRRHKAGGSGRSKRARLGTESTSGASASTSGSGRSSPQTVRACSFFFLSFFMETHSFLSLFLLLSLSLRRPQTDDVALLGGGGARDARGGSSGAVGIPQLIALYDTVRCLLCTVTFHANHAHNLTRSP